MTFFCLLETGSSTATHMEALEAECQNAAIQEAVRILTLHTSASIAHVLSGDKVVATISDYRRALGSHPFTGKARPYP